MAVKDKDNTKGKGKAKASRRTPSKKTKDSSPEKIFQSRSLRLYQQLDKGFHLNALKTCNQLLAQKAPFNPTWIDTKAKLLTVLERYQETIDFLSGNSIDSVGLELLEAYCFYKLGDFQKASAVLSSPRIATQDDMGRAKLALESQILFKLGRYAEAKAHLEDLLIDSQPGHPEHLDLNANLAACEARVEFIEKHIPSQTSLINIDRLEAAPITAGFFHSHPDFPTSSGTRPSKSAKQSGATKPTKPLDPSRPPPDPTRWLPRSEKERAKPAKRRNAQHIKAKEKLATQGAVSLPPSAADPSALKHPKQIQRKKKNKK